MSRRHVLLHAVAITLALAGLGLVVAGFEVHRRANDAVQGAAQRAAIDAASTPNPACNPARGSGYMGVCAPAQAFSVADQLGVAAGDPDNITTPIGTDVSDNQGCDIDWPATVKTYHLTFVYIKATESTTDTDACLAHNVAGVKAAGVPYGLYDFLRPGESSSTAEAEHFEAEVDEYGSELPPAGDFEVTDGETPTQVSAYDSAWIKTVSAGLHRVLMSYGGPYFWNDEIGDSALGTDEWDADWSTEPLLAHAWTSWKFWQYAAGSIGPTPHVGTWDADTFNGTLAQLDALAGIKPASKPTPAKTTSTPTATTATPKPKPKPAVCFKEDGRDLKPITTACKAIDHRHAFDAGRREHWHKVMVRTRDHSSTTYEHALHWYRVRRGEAHEVWLEHSA